MRRPRRRRHRRASRRWTNVLAGDIRRVLFPPEMVTLVEEWARPADVASWLQDTVDNADARRPRGSRGQYVAIPELDAPRQYRAQSPPWSSSWICPTTTMRTATTPATSSR